MMSAICLKKLQEKKNVGEKTMKKDWQWLAAEPNFIDSISQLSCIFENTKFNKRNCRKYL